MTGQMLAYLLREGLAEIVGNRVRLTPYGLGTLIRLRWLRDQHLAGSA